ncbi:LAME_0H05402g1_1 [Lachancea meyersii CBS 8951]|uniref:LAME_0H05402g1_1 n=1 Tax=Lachancea meyersii CBS 8951 TaxID=1266667 RepID=A0A1G4KEB8_9SACH|nr:LAME_0H05402g1_1 [Lachancea meyersii CBS 8951]
MSLPLRHPLDTAASLDRVLEDLIVRFIINCPPEDFSSVERELFHVEEANWFYTDYVKILNPNLPNLKIKSFAQHVIKLCPMVWKWDVRAEQALQKFSQYKRSIPVRGAAIFNQKLTKLLLVKGTESDSWSFPRGKISKDENDVDCCVREVLEETGCDISDYINENAFIERNIGGKNYKIFLVSGIPEDFKFEPKVRNEIEKIQWHDFKKLSRSCNPKTAQVKIYLVNNLMRPLAMWVKSNRQIGDDEKLKAHVETQLKLLLGIKKEDISDPGRELLNMLQSTVSAGNATSNQALKVDSLSKTESNANTAANAIGTVGTSNAATPLTAIPAPTFVAPPPQFQHSFPFMAFQPFAPFPFMNGAGLQIGAVPQPENSSSSSESTQPPPTPKMNSLAKPTVVEEEERQESNLSQANPLQHASAKQLLDILNKKNLNKPASPPGQQSTPANVGFRGHDEASLDLNTSPKTLLSLLNKPQKQASSEQETKRDISAKPDFAKITLTSVAQLPDVHNASTTGTDISEYEDFESCSESDSEDKEEEVQEDPLESFSAKYARDNKHQRQKMEASGKQHTGQNFSNTPNFLQTSSAEIPITNIPKAHPGVATNDLLHNPNFKDIKTKESLNVQLDLQTENQEDKNARSQVKPKFKLLKRGEMLNDVLDSSEIDKSVEEERNTFKVSDGKVLLNMLKKAPVSCPPSRAENAPTNNDHTHAADRESTLETGKKMDSDILLNLLKNGKPGLFAQPPRSSSSSQHCELENRTMQKDSGSESSELLKMLRGHSPGNSMTRPAERVPPSADINNPPSSFSYQILQRPLPQDENASKQLLGMLKNASK